MQTEEIRVAVDIGSRLLVIVGVRPYILHSCCCMLCAIVFKKKILGHGYKITLYLCVFRTALPGAFS